MSQLRSAAPEYDEAGVVDALGAAGTGAAGAFAGAAAAAASASRTAMTVPFETLSPIFTRSSRTTPASDDGISIVALSDSSVMSDASFATRSPGLTSTSMTSTLWKSPMSGTFTSIIWATPSSSQKGTADVGQDRGEIGGEPRPGCAVDDAVIVGERQRQHQARNESPVLEHRSHMR